MVLRGARWFGFGVGGRAVAGRSMVRRAGLALVSSRLRELGVRRPRRCPRLLGEQPGRQRRHDRAKRLDGSGVNFGAHTGAPNAGNDMAVDGAHIYWTNRNGGNADRPGQPRRHRRQPELHQRGLRPAGVAVDGSTSTGRHRRGDDTIGRANLDGTGVNQNFITSASSARPRDRGRRQHIYWANGDGGTIGRANLDGTGVNQSFISGEPDPSRGRGRRQHIYWTSRTTHDRAGQPRRHRRQPELHLRRQAPTGWRSTASTSTGPTRADNAARSAGPTSTAPASTRASSRSRAPASPDGLAVNALLGAPKPQVCSGSFTKPGVLKGAYPDGVVVKGVCFVNDGKAHVTGTLTVTKGSVLAAAFGEHHSSLTVTGNLVVDRRAVAVLGCKVNPNGTGQACLDDHSKHPTLTSHERVSGNIIANHALGLIVHNSAIGHGIKDIGGGGGATCAVPKTGIFAAFKSPVFSDLEDSTIGGDDVMNGLRTCWFGLARDTVRGYVTINVNKTADPDAIEVLANHIGKSLSCAGNRHPGIPASVGAFPIWDSADGPSPASTLAYRSPTPWAAVAAGSA